MGCALAVAAQTPSAVRAQRLSRDKPAAATATKLAAQQPPVQATGAALNDGAQDPATRALCPVVYPDDATPTARGYRYTFFGNAFFINDQGYLLTVAHVLETFGHGGQAYVLVNRRNAPPQLVKVGVVAKDEQHDVAILRAMPNPFDAKYETDFLPLASEPAARGEAVLALSLRPKRAQDAHSFEYQQEDGSAGTVLAIESTQLQKTGLPAEVFLLSHPVAKGQSGSAVLDVNSRSVVGLIEGLWLRGVSLSSAKQGRLPSDTPGVAIPIRYAIALLEASGVSWNATSAKSAAAQSVAKP